MRAKGLRENTYVNIWRRKDAEYRPISWFVINGKSAQDSMLRGASSDETEGSFRSNINKDSGVRILGYGNLRAPNAGDISIH